MGNTLKMGKRELLHELFRKGWSNRKINNVTQIHRDTVSRYRKLWTSATQGDLAPGDGADGGEISSSGSANPSQNRPLKCPPEGVAYFEVTTDPPVVDPATSRSQSAEYHEAIQSKLKCGQNARSIYQDLYVEEDYRGSYQSVKRYVRKLRRQSPQLYARLEHPPGLEAQVDFGQGAPTLKNGRYRRPWLFVMTLSNSRKSYEEVVWHQDVETFIRCHERAFTHLGGVPRTVKLDNLKAGVLVTHLYEPDLNPNYLSYAQHAGFVPLPCQPRKPEHKGTVEAGVKYVQNNALAGKRFDSLDSQNSHLRDWNRRWASPRIHGTTKRQVRQMYAEELPHLQALPEREFAFFKIGTRKVSNTDSHIEVAGAYYPVPPRLMGRTVVVHFNSLWVKVFHSEDLVQCLSAVEKGHFHPDKSCLPENKAMDHNRWQERTLAMCHGIGVEAGKWADACLQNRGFAAWRSIQGVATLAKKYQRRDKANHGQGHQDHQHGQ